MMDMAKQNQDMARQNQELIAKLASNAISNTPQSTSEEAASKNIYTPLRRKITYRMYYVKYDAE
jgi:hypothetical protein